MAVRLTFLQYFFSTHEGKTMTFVKNLPRQRQNEILGILLLALGALVFISLISYVPQEDYLLTSHPFSARTGNLMGPVGQMVASAAILIFGYFSFFIPVMLFLWGLNRFLGSDIHATIRRTLYLLGLMVFLGALAGLIYPMSESPDLERRAAAIRAGGMVGSAVAYLLLRYLHVFGAYLVTITALLVLVISLTGLGLRNAVFGIGSVSAGLVRGLVDLFKWAPWAKARTRPAVARAQRKSRPKDEHKIEKKRHKADKLRHRLAAVQADVAEEEERRQPPQIVQPEELAPRDQLGIKPMVLPSGHKYQLPSMNLLHSPPSEDRGQDEEELFANAEILESRLADFGVSGKVVQVSPGPVITRYEVKPAPGVKVSRFVNLADDLALAMRAQRIRVEAPIPGKDVVGIEIPNRQPSIVYLREILGSSPYRKKDSMLTLALGKTIAGEPFCADLARMPHLLIAGATGSGKSVCIHSIVASILYRATPNDVRFLLIDPKMLELTVFNKIPHLLSPVVIEPKEAVKVLRWAVAEMDRRYQILAAAAVRNIDAYNAKKGQQPSLPGMEPSEEEGALPYIVIIVDELADLMLTVSNEIEDTIGRLAQMARAVGIHLVLATQRPSVDVITGVIKANFPTRIAFQVASKIDSRTILDINGAEKLLGRGDMLFLPPGRPDAVRLHGAFVSAEETDKIASFLAGQKINSENIPTIEEQVAAVSVAAERDDLYDQALRLVIRHQQGSVSLLQRRLKIGYARAGRLMDQLEADGIVGPFDGSKARQVLVDPHYLDDLEMGNMTTI
jgi:S-DNA-T family DNA segregation ATPase FtsK/SpoIIIE